MAIPDRPLEVTLDVDELTLDELALFEPTGFSIVGFRAFMAEHTNWTLAEIGKIKVKEFKDIQTQLAEKFKEASVPLANSPS
jgi:hypothetical protein